MRVAGRGRNAVTQPIQHRSGWVRCQSDPLGLLLITVQEQYKLNPLTCSPAPIVGGMDNRADIRGFLASRRAKLSPRQVGLPPGARRRVPGLRREEVAALAGVSIEWYTRLEKGHIAGVSEEVLDAVAHALRLDEEERTHLFDLDRAARPAHRRATRRREAALAPPV